MLRIIGIRARQLTTSSRTCYSDYAEYLNKTWNPEVIPCDPRKNLPDQINAPHKDATERFRNRKITSRKNAPNLTERIAHVTNTTTRDGNHKRSRPTHSWLKKHNLDVRWPGGIVPPTLTEQRYSGELNERYKEAYKQTNDESVPEVDSLNDHGRQLQGSSRIRNQNLEYFPGPSQFGRDHRLGFMPTEILWKDERTNYWKGLQEDDSGKELKMKDKRNEWFKSTKYEDVYRGNRRGKRKFLHSSNANLDTRYYDPNVLRIGPDWAPFDETVDAIETRKLRKEVDALFTGVPLPEKKKDAYVIPQLACRGNIPHGMPTLSDAILIFGGALSDADFDINNEDVTDLKTLKWRVKRIIRHGKMEQVDAGDYGPEPPLFDPRDPGFGSIDKTNIFKGHMDRRSLYEEAWKWDERFGLTKPERSSKIIAENLSRLFYYEIKDQNSRMFRAKNENIFSQFMVDGNNVMQIDDESVEVWYSKAPVKKIECSTSQIEDEMVYSPLQLLERHPVLRCQTAFENETKECVELRDTILDGNSYLNTIVMSDYATPQFNQSPRNINRFTGDRERERKFLPILRDKMTASESLGRLVLASYAKLYNEAMMRDLLERDLEIPLVLNGISITDGQMIHFIQTQLYSTDLKSENTIKVIRCGSFKFFELCDVFVWHRGDRFEEFDEKTLESAIKTLKKITVSLEN